MASIRIGINSEFNLVDSKVGIGTTNPTELVDVRGQIYSDNSIGAGGISTVTNYQGFLDTKQTIKSSSEGTVVAGTLSGEIIIEGEVTVSSGTTYTSGLSELTATNKFTLPGMSGSRPTEGTTRFNENLAALEFYTGTEWRAVNSYVDMGNRGRGVFTGGTDASYGNFIDFVNIPTLGNAQDFGNTITSARFATACSSGTRGVFAIGYKSPGASANEIEYITIAAGGNAIDFGDNTTSGYAQASLSSSTRGIWAGGQTPSGYTNVIDYVEIATIGNAVDFGDTTTPIDGSAGVASPIRGVIGGGRNPDSGSTGISVIQSITIASKGNAVDDGDLTHRRKDLGGMSNSTRGIFSGGRDGAAGIQFSDIDFITIATTGNAQDFGNLTFTGAYLASASNQTRGVTAGGSTTGVKWNIINYITIATTGNAQDFGDLTVGRYALGGLSDSHGGLGGF